MFPADAVRAHRVFRRGRQFIAGCQKGVCHIRGIRRFGQIVGRPDLDRSDRGGDRTVSGKNHNTAIRAAFAQDFYNIKAVSILEPQVNDGECRWPCRCNGAPRSNRSGGFNLEPAFLHRLGKTPQKSLIIIDQQKRFIRSDIQRRNLSHSISSARHAILLQN